MERIRKRPFESNAVKKGCVGDVMLLFAYTVKKNTDSSRL